MRSNAALALLRDEDHLSCSAINTFLRCPRQFEHRYVLHTPPAHRSAALAFGSAVHRALAHHYRALMEGRPALSSDELSAAFADAWRDELATDVPVLFERDPGGAMLDKGVTLLRVFHDAQRDPQRVLAVEEPFSIALPQIADAPRFVGVLDAVVESNGGACIVLEHKTAARRWSKDRQAHDLQVTAYGIAAEGLGFGRARVRIQLLLKTKEPSFEALDLQRGDQDRADFLSIVRGVVRSIRAGVAYPVRGWQCNGCPYAGACIAG